ncbi:MAG: hypothetical protein GZ091_11065 [Paludibacter sp.]|nr:hypothetical protein [Paludibacter sp.]
MKKVSIIPIVFCLILTGCSYLLNSTNKAFEDEFKNTKTYTIEQTLRPIEFNSKVSSAILTFSRTITDSGESVKVYFIIARSTSSFKVDKKGFMKANGSKFEFISEPEASEYKSIQESSTTTTTTKDSSSVKTTYNTDVKNTNWYDDKLVVQLTPDMVKSVLQTDELLYRFYFGPEQVSFRLKGFTLQRVKKLFENKL